MSSGAGRPVAECLVIKFDDKATTAISTGCRIGASGFETRTRISGDR